MIATTMRSTGVGIAVTDVTGRNAETTMIGGKGVNAVIGAIDNKIAGVAKKRNSEDGRMKGKGCDNQSRHQLHNSRLLLLQLLPHNKLTFHQPRYSSNKNKLDSQLPQLQRL